MGRISKANKLEIEIINNVNMITNASSEEIESAEKNELIAFDNKNEKKEIQMNKESQPIYYYTREFKHWLNSKLDYGIF